ncbi:MAG: hypothetical protein H6657_32600 [Ardenticatenaceae bacterium]|nr:hypothetical protein [Ardenticatenaceae bacterium]
MKTNSQILLSTKIYLGDIDGDSLDEIIEVDGRHIYIFKCQLDHKPLLEHVFPHPVIRLIIGDFVSEGREHGKDQLLAILSDGSLQGFAISDDLTEMWWWFKQTNFIQSNEHYIVGDFDGDGADEIMKYRPSTGSIDIFEKKPNSGFQKMNGFTLGNLKGFDLRKKLILGGNFGQAKNRTDIVVIDKSVGQIVRFDTATDKKGKKTFWWAFTSKTGLLSEEDEVIVANIDGSTRDGILIRKFDTGTYHLLKLEYDNGNLSSINNVEVGQLPIRLKEGCMVAAKVRNKSFRRELGGIRRDDILFFNSKNKEFIRTDARYDKAKGQLTYWWAYTSNLICEPQRKTISKPWAIILCKFKGMDGDPVIERFFREIFTPGSGGLVEYWHDATLGAIDISQSKVFGWVELDIQREQAAIGRKNLIDKAISACRRNGIEPVWGFHKQIAVFTHDFTKDGAPPDTNWTNKHWKPFWIDGSADGEGRVSAPPHTHSGSFIAHEMGHGMGFDHDLAADLKTHYGDRNCLMSAMNIKGFIHPKWNNSFGPTMSFPQLFMKNWMYKRRTCKFSVSWFTKSPGISFKMAPIHDRRLNAYLGVILPIPKFLPFGDYYLEYLRPFGWNKGFGEAVLVIRQITNNKSVFLGEIALPSKLQEKRSWVEPRLKVKFEIQKIRSDERIIQVNVVSLSEKT